VVLLPKRFTYDLVHGGDQHAQASVDRAYARGKLAFAMDSNNSSRACVAPMKLN
jgi:hypothetical protein